MGSTLFWISHASLLVKAIPLLTIPGCVCFSIYITLLYCSICQQTLGSLQNLGLVNSAAKNTGQLIPLQNSDLIPFGFILRNEIAGACDGSVFSFLRNIHMVFHNGSTSLHFCQQSTRVPFPLCFQWSWFLLDVPVMVTPARVRWLSLWFWLACNTCFICCWSSFGFPGKKWLCRCFAHCGQLVVTWHEFVRYSEDYSLPGIWPTTTFTISLIVFSFRWLLPLLHRVHPTS